ncbi:MAG: GNAT family N-acetyltransferase [Cyanobacteria bacterium J06649_4]
MTVATVRQANPDDAECFSQLAERAFRETFTTEENLADMALYCKQTFGVEVQSRELRDPNNVLLLAEVEGRLAGFAQIRLCSPKDCVEATQPLELYRLYVLRPWHGRGVAQELMERVLAIAAESNADQLWLGVWEHNPRAIAFYKKYGFQFVGEHVFQFGNDPQRDLIMMKAVDAAI